VKRGARLCFGVLLGFAVGVTCGAPSASAQTNNKSVSSLGKLSGLVRDSSGVPQLGATVAILSETPGAIATYQFLTNTEGIFNGEKLAPGSYTVRVTLAGFLPFLEKHIQISPNLTTTVRIQLESMFASIEQLRRPPAASAAEADDWKWVLRSASGLRPVLQWNDPDPSWSIASSIVVEQNLHRPLGIVALTDGARRPGSVSNVAAAPSTAFAYDQKITGSNHIVFAGQITPDEESPAGDCHRLDADRFRRNGSLEHDGAAGSKTRDQRPDFSGRSPGSKRNPRPWRSVPYTGRRGVRSGWLGSAGFWPARARETGNPRHS